MTKATIDQTFNIGSNWALLLRSKVISPGKSDLYLEVNRHFLLACLRPHLARIRVDEGWYLARYSDIKQAIQDGMLRSGKEHYIRYGFVENRIPYEIEVNDAWYLERYPDVKSGVQAGDWKSAQQHFETLGYSEGRFPYADFTLAQEDSV